MIGQTAVGLDSVGICDEATESEATIGTSGNKFRGKKWSRWGTLGTNAVLTLVLKKNLGSFSPPAPSLRGCVHGSLSAIHLG